MRVLQEKLMSAMCAAGLVLVCLAADTAGPAPPPSFPSWLEAEMGQSGVPGVSIAVIKDYRIEWAAGFGIADIAHGARVTSETLFQAASVSKPITALAVMISFEDHGLSIDDD